MYSGKAEIKKKIGSKGFYGKIELKVDLIRDFNVDISFNHESQLKWESAIKAGAQYFYDKNIRYKKAGIEVKVLSIHDMIVDSSFMVFFYLTYSALCDAFQLNNLIKINEDAEFVVPK